MSQAVVLQSSGAASGTFCRTIVESGMEFSNLAALAVLCVRRMRRNRRRSESGQQVRPRTLVLPRAPRVVRERVTLDGMTDAQIVETYRLNRQQLNDLYELLKDDLEPRKCMRTAIPGMSKMLCCLHFLASGSFQTAEGRMGGVAQSSFSKVLFNFLKAMRDKCHQFIGFPTTPQGWRKLKRGFFELGGIPNVVGAIHCTHIVMRAPANQGQVYMNRKNVHSLNVQVVCDAKMRIMNVFTSFPGIPHGSYILQNSSVAHNFETGEFPQGWLLGEYNNSLFKLVLMFKTLFYIL
uniref:Putative nuclease HARBI1 n=1 Tax=Leptobrachium leishanense TaxID=445787 RepID=A0A8C5PS95_9ANUR